MSNTQVRADRWRRWTAGIGAAGAGATAIVWAGLLVGGAGAAQADALCDQLRAQYGPGWPCVSVPPPQTVAPPEVGTLPGGPAESGSGPQAGAGGLNPGPGNGTPIVPVPGQDPVLPPPPVGQPGEIGRTTAPAQVPAVTTVPPADAGPSPESPTQGVTPGDGGQTSLNSVTPQTGPVVEQFSPADSGDTDSSDIPLAAWVVGGAAALTAAHPRAGQVLRRVGGFRHVAPATVMSSGSLASGLLPAGGSERGQLGSMRLVLTNDATSPDTYVFDMNVPPGGRTVVNPDGSATVYDADGNPISYVKRPWAVDSLGRPQKTWYTVDENGNLVQHVEAAPNALYPILADPDETAALGGQALTQAEGLPEGSSWETPIYDGNGVQTGTIVNTIPEGNGDQTVDQTFLDPSGNMTSQARVTSNGEGGYQRWGDNVDGSSGYQGQDAPGDDVYGGSWDSGYDPGADAPNSVYGQTWNGSQSSTVRENGDGTQTVVNSEQQDGGNWVHQTQLSDGTTVSSSSGPGGENTTTTAVLDENGDGWVTLENGNRAEVFHDGNGNPAMKSTDPATGHTTYQFIKDGQTQSNTFDDDGNLVGRSNYNEDGSLAYQWSKTDQGEQWINVNPDGSRVVEFQGADGSWQKVEYNPDDSGTIFNGDFSKDIFDTDGNITEHVDAPDDRSTFEKVADNVVGVPVGIAKGAWKAGKDVGTLTGKNFWDGDEKAQNTQDAWKGVGKTAEAGALYLGGAGDLANSGNVPGLPQQGEAGEILRGVRDGFIARDAFANGNYGEGIGEVSFNVLSSVIGTKGLGTAGTGGRAALRGAAAGESALPTVKGPLGLDTEVGNVSRAAPRSTQSAPGIRPPASTGQNILTPTKAPTGGPSVGVPQSLPTAQIAPNVTWHDITTAPTPPQRVPQDIAASPKAPDPLPTSRPVGNSGTQNSFVQQRIQELFNAGATDIRVNQQQITAIDERFGINRPDLQYTFGTQRFYEEFDVPSSSRGPDHLARLLANDPSAIVGLLIVP